MSERRKGEEGRKGEMRGRGRMKGEGRQGGSKGSSGGGEDWQDLQHTREVVEAAVSSDRLGNHHV